MKDIPFKNVSHAAHICSDMHASTKFLEDFDDVLATLRDERGLEVRTIYHGLDKPSCPDPDDPDVWIRSLYFTDPDGFQLEVASLRTALDPRKHVLTDPRNAKGEKVPYTPLLLRDKAAA